MKHFKKLMALVIAAVMVMGTMSLAGAADGDQMVDPTKDNLITVSGLTTGDTVNFYQVLEWKGSEGTYGGWSLTSTFASFAENYNEAAEADTDPKHTAAWLAIRDLIGDPTADTPVPMNLTSEIAGKLADLATAGAKPGSTVADGKSTLTIDGTNNTLGLYMALITPNDQDTVYNPVFVSGDYNTTNGTNSFGIENSASSYSDNAAAKKSTISVDKKATGSTNGYDTSEKTWRSTRPGEVVAFEVNTTIPGYGEVYQHPHFVLNDKLSDMQLVANSVTLTAPATKVVNGETVNLVKGTGAANVLATDADYYITEDTANNGGYTITFTESYLKTVKAPVEVTVTYSATVTSTAKMNVNLEKNEVWIEYSHDPTKESDYMVKKDDTNHYTYTIDADILGNWGDETRTSGSEIIKVGIDADGKPITKTQVKSVVTTSNYQTGPLEGAEFKLYKAEACGETDEYTKVDGTKYALKSDASGRIKIEGLDAGKYWIKETKAPSGYIADQRAISIEIIPEFTTESYRQWWDATNQAWSDSEISGAKYADFDVEVLQSYRVLVNGVEASKYTFTNVGPKKITISSEGVTEVPQSIVNTKGTELPSTGGMGTTLFYTIGAILVLGAGILLVSKRRMSAN